MIGDGNMQLYKYKDNNFFIQLDHDEFKNDDLTKVIVQKHDGADEKHQPVVTYENKHIKVKIGEIMHPMTQEHHISMIFLKTKQGGQYKLLSYSDTPIVTFELTKDDEPLEVYGYCNLHGLWKKEI